MSKLLVILWFLIFSTSQLFATTLSGIVYGDDSPLPNSTISFF